MFVEEILAACSNKDLAETGGAHGQKGVDFQRYFAVMRMFELLEAEADDFLLIFEAIQDVSEFDHSEAPTAVRIYQVKKKDRKEWTWNDLTGQVDPGKGKAVDADKFSLSPMGKLYMSVAAFKAIASEGCFVSNAGCDLPLADGSNAASAPPCDASALHEKHCEVLKLGFAAIDKTGGGPKALSRFRLAKIPLPPDAPDKQVIGMAANYLGAKSVRHAGQAKAFVEALIAKIAPLGRKTYSYKAFDELKRAKGFTKKELVDAFGALELLPDQSRDLDEWLHKLNTEGMDVMLATQIRMAAAGILRLKLVSSQPMDDAELTAKMDKWIEKNPPAAQLLPFVEGGYMEFKDAVSHYNRPQIIARLLLRGIQICAAQTYGD